ncbi:nuclear transport factor 2 family protein [Mycobacterium sp. ITM-2016-00317]|uniref:nuclear transport factor 2 family protein n=1 Tax=Mycobacterium sp. ITM-2016-00317 TaxID=2099694 RepID=UPI000D4EFC15|nr:nuclear transport factor 2 family protein [Mycobacterium sp. ITM-2016-00317]WNG85600.1 nuclear transport factor 2 family protein [Mycobacterium sp. ITM-2016-00317]
MATDTHSQSAIAWADLPAAVTTYLTAHRDGEVAAALAAFADDASVTDEGHTHTGRAAVADWLANAGGDYTYTTEFRRAEKTGAAEYDVLQHLEGDFPGGVADLHYRFTMAGERVRRLVIEP